MRHRQAEAPGEAARGRAHSTCESSGGPRACRECARNTLGPAAGAGTLAHCLACPASSSAAVSGRTSVLDCRCDTSHYQR
eukprot:2219043-Rhodomonas_salina.2